MAFARELARLIDEGLEVIPAMTPGIRGAFPGVADTGLLAAGRAGVYLIGREDAGRLVGAGGAVAFADEPA